MKTIKNECIYSVSGEVNCFGLSFTDNMSGIKTGPDLDSWIRFLLLYKSFHNAPL